MIQFFNVFFVQCGPFTLPNVQHVAALHQTALLYSAVIYLNCSAPNISSLLCPTLLLIVLSYPDVNDFIILCSTLHLCLVAWFGYFAPMSEENLNMEILSCIMLLALELNNIHFESKALIAYKTMSAIIKQLI